MSMLTPQYGFYEAVMNGAVGSVYMSAKMKKMDLKQFVMVVIEKFVINRLSSIVAEETSTVTTPGEQLIE